MLFAAICLAHLSRVVLGLSGNLLRFICYFYMAIKMVRAHVDKQGSAGSRSNNLPWRVQHGCQFGPQSAFGIPPGPLDVFVELLTCAGEKERLPQACGKEVTHRKRCQSTSGWSKICSNCTLNGPKSGANRAPNVLDPPCEAQSSPGAPKRCQERPKGT